MRFIVASIGGSEIDSLVAAVEPAPDDRVAAETVLERFPWARPTPTVLSFPEGHQGAEMAQAKGQTST